MFAATLTALLVLPLLLGPVAARADVITLVRENGRPVFINTEDEELRRAVRRGGAAAALSLIEQRRKSLRGLETHIDKVSRQYGVDPALVQAVIEVESAWNPRARSYKGALGLMQLLPETGARFGVRDPYDPEENVTGGVRYLRFLLDRFGGNLRLALAAYNAGENAVDENGGVPPYRETRAYLARLEALYGKLGLGRGKGYGSIYRTVDERGRVIFENE